MKCLLLRPAAIIGGCCVKKIINDDLVKRSCNNVKYIFTGD